MLIIAEKYGELGNRLFTFANVLAFAVEHNVTVINPAFEEYACWFRSTAESLLCHYPPTKGFYGKRRGYRHGLFKAANYLMRINSKINIFSSVRLGWQQKFDFCSKDPTAVRLMARMKSGATTFLDGFYFLDHKNFIKHSEIIRDYFRPVVAVERRVADYIADVRKDGDILIGVHMRQGDYKIHSNGLMYYTAEEYAAVLRKIIGLFNGKPVKLIICSNERQSPDYFGEFTFQFGPGNFMEDLYTLASCDYIVGAPSTFTQWASFYGRVPKYMINYKNEQYYGVESKDPEMDDFRVHSCGFGKYLYSENNK
ncbi:MAG: hypothetical protein ACHQ0Y_09205 [Thermodesulfovibrionales bacterium]